MHKCEEVSGYFGSLTFGLREMKDKLPSATYRELLKNITHGRKLGNSASNEIAQTIKDWALNNGATHFCHWLQRLNGQTAE